MTSNQIAAEANMIQKEMNEWSMEHNTKIAEETKRHNQEMEVLQANAVAAQEHGNQIQENWNRWQQQWQQDYQAKFSELQIANEERKTDIQAQLANLEERRVIAEEAYKAAQEANLTYMQGIAADQLALDEGFKQWQIEMGNKNYELNEFQAKVKAKEVEYQYAVQHEQNVNTRNWQIAQNTYNYALLNWEREKTTRQLQNALLLGNYNYEIGKANVNIAQQNLDLYSKKVTAENFQSYASGLFGKSGIIPGTMETVSSGIKLFGGFANGKTAIKVAEALLFK